MGKQYFKSGTMESIEKLQTSRKGIAEFDRVIYPAGVVELSRKLPSGGRRVKGVVGDEAATQDVDERFDGEFDEEEGFGDEIVAAAHGGVGPAFEIGKAGDENNGSLLVERDGAEFGAKLEAIHARHIDIQED